MDPKQAETLNKYMTASYHKGVAAALKGVILVGCIVGIVMKLLK